MRLKDTGKEPGVAGSFVKNAYRTVRKVYKDSSLKKVYPSRYLAETRKPVKPGYVVFLEVREKELSDNFRLIKAALEHRNRVLRTEAFEKGAGGLKGKQGDHYSFDTVCIREGMENPASSAARCMAAIPKIARAEFVFVSESSYFLSSLPIRPETTVIQTWHACGAFKKFGWSTIGKGFGTSAADLEEYPVHRNFSYVTVSSEEVIWAYAEAFHMEDRIEDILPIGVSRTDLYFHPKMRQNAANRVRRTLISRDESLWTEESPLDDLGGTFGDEDASSGTLDQSGAEDFSGGAEGAGGGAFAKSGLGAGYASGETFADRRQERVFTNKKLILYAPTYRGSVREAKSPDQLDILQMKKELGDGYLLLIKQHPFVKKKAVIPKEAEDFAYDVSDMRIEDLIMASDLLITDYSSIVFEYSLFEKPMLFFACDLEDYEQQRGFYYPVTEMMPGPVAKTTHDVTRIIRRMDQNFDLVRVREFKYRFMGACDGHVTGRILKLMDTISEQKRQEKEKLL